MILYEYPFSERIRTYLRLEHLFERLAELVSRTTSIDHHYALATIFEVMDVAARADLKSDVMKDLEKQKSVLGAFRGVHGVSEQTLDSVLEQLDRCFTAHNNQPGKAGQALTENDWLMSIRSRIGIPGGTCEFDLPAYYAWCQGDSARRQADLRRWCVTLTTLTQSIGLLLKLLRESGNAQKVMTIAGQYQQSLPQGRSFQLLRLLIDPALDLVPEISANRLIVSVRLMRLGPDDRLHPANDEVGFDLTLCA